MIWTGVVWLVEGMNYPSDSGWREIFKSPEVLEAWREVEARLKKVPKGQITPEPQNIFRAFELTPLNKVKVVIVGLDPYKPKKPKLDEHQATGLAFSVKKGEPLPPSLKRIFTKLSPKLGKPFTMPKDGDLSEWAKAGVLLVNTRLTTSTKLDIEHTGFGWEKWVGAVLRLAQDKVDPRGEKMVWLLWGGAANLFFDKYILDPARAATQEKRVLRCSHPSPLGATKKCLGYPSFVESEPFVEATRLLKG